MKAQPTPLAIPIEICCKEDAATVFHHILEQLQIRYYLYINQYGCNFFSYSYAGMFISVAYLYKESRFFDA